MIVLKQKKQEKKKLQKCLKPYPPLAKTRRLSSKIYFWVSSPTTTSDLEERFLLVKHPTGYDTLQMDGATSWSGVFTEGFVQWELLPSADTCTFLLPRVFSVTPLSSRQA
jgi:hypothetical protein